MYVNLCFSSVDVKTYLFTIVSDNFLFYHQNILPSPIIYPKYTFVNDYVDITISDKMKGTVIYYTLDGSDPTPASAIYDGTPISLTASTVVTAISTKVGYETSDANSVEYTVKVSKPVIADVPKNVLVGRKYSLDVHGSTTNPQSTVHCTTNGDIPTTDSPSFGYEGYVLVTPESLIVLCMAHVNGCVDSETVSRTLGE